MSSSPGFDLDPEIMPYSVSPERWGVLSSVALLTIANNILWISYAAVNTASAAYYEKTSADIDLLTTVSFIIGIPFCLASTYVVDKKGIK